MDLDIHSLGHGMPLATDIYDRRSEPFVDRVIPVRFPYPDTMLWFHLPVISWKLR